jgi:hypothetical protein
MKVATETFAGAEALALYLIERSKADRGAFLGVVRPFSHTTDIHRFDNPSKCPDHLIDLAAQLPDENHCIAFRGRLRGFTKAAQIREQNRGLGRE